jgi:hypothetical protein
MVSGYHWLPDLATKKAGYLTFEHSKFKKMNNLLYLIAVLLIIGWAIGFVGFHIGGLVHILLFLALVAVLLRIIRGNRPM